MKKVTVFISTLLAAAIPILVGLNAHAASGEDKAPARSSNSANSRERERPVLRHADRKRTLRRGLGNRLQDKTEKPTPWRLRQPLPAPQMEFDPDAPVVDVAAESAKAGAGVGDLDPTIDVQITQEIIDLATELGTPQAMYEFVRNEVEFQPYYGSRKGSVETLHQRAGNDYDLASLLIALLRASGTPARYAEGQVEMSLEQATSWLAVEDGGVAGSILFTNGMEGTSIVSSSTTCCFANGTPGCDDPTIEACVCALDSFCCNNQWDQTCADEVDSFGCAVCDDLTDVVAVRAQRIWVETFTPRGFGSPTWVPLDPAFGANEVQAGLDIPSEMGLDAQTFIDDYWDPTLPVTLPRAETPIELLEQQITDYLAVNHPGLTLDDVGRSSSGIDQSLGVLPPSLPYIVRSRDGFFSEIPSDRRYQIRFHLYDGGTTFIDQTLNLPEVAGRRVSISYEGATAGDQATIDSFNGLLFTPPNSINIRPLLKVAGQTVATGAAGIGAGRAHSNDIHFLAPVNSGGLPQNVVPAVFNTIVAGELQAIGLAVHGVFNPFLLPEDPTDVESFIAQERFGKAMSYLERGLLADERLAELMHARVTVDVADAIVKDDILVTLDGLGNPIAWEWSGLTVDADRLVIGAWDVNEFQSGCGGTGSEILIIGGAEGSLNENLIWETDYTQEAVSTMKILQLAVDQGITVYKRWSSLPLPPNTQPPSTRSAIEGAILSGNEVTFPADPITYFNWTGTGYISMDPCDGAAGYIIAGGQSGGSTVDSWTDIIWANPFKTVVAIQGRVNNPAQDSPDPGAAFCDLDTTRLFFQYQLRAEYDDTSVGGWASRSHRSKAPSQLAAGNYVLVVGDKGEPGNDQHIRKLSIVKIEKVTATGATEITAVGNMDIQHFVTPKGSGDVTLTAEIKPTSPPELKDLISWEGATQDAADKLKATVSKTAAKKFDIKIKFKNTTVKKELRAWVVWSTIAATSVPIAGIIDSTFGIVRGGYRFKASVMPTSIFSDSDRPKLEGANSSNPPGTNNGCGNPLSGGVAKHWDITRQIRKKVVTKPAGWPNANWLPPPCIYIDILSFPANNGEGNDDAGTGDEDNDPYNSPDANKLMSSDRPTRGAKHSGGALNDTIEIRLHFKEFARLELDGTWQRISDNFPWRVHFKFKKVNISEAMAGVDINGDGDTMDTVPGWKNDGTLKDTTNNGW